MARRTENSEKPGLLPVPELNPLINPVLAQNMGRWAEVYFTSPPEKRDERVLELLHELEGEGSESSPDNTRQTSHVHEAQKKPVRCDSCGQDNPEDQRFCGMCGAKLNAAYAEAEANFFSDEPVEHVDGMERDQEVPLFRSGREFESLDENFGWTLDSESSSRPYRFYIGTVLVIIIAILAFMAWRTAQSGSLSSAAPSAPTEAAPAKPQDTSPAPANPEAQQAASTHEDAADSGKGSSPPAEPSTQKNSGQESTPAENSSDDAAQLKSTLGNGSQELAMAQKYLDGTAGQGRNSSEAAKWLWQSVAKHNSDATLLLSGLYLKGDGVAKNCDQARVLLDAAASKGSKEAGERLRHMQAFGCQ